MIHLGNFVIIIILLLINFNFNSNNKKLDEIKNHLIYSSCGGQ